MDKKDFPEVYIRQNFNAYMYCYIVCNSYKTIAMNLKE